MRDVNMLIYRLPYLEYPSIKTIKTKFNSIQPMLLICDERFFVFSCLSVRELSLKRIKKYQVFNVIIN